jgi:hypothetical protein
MNDYMEGLEGNLWAWCGGQPITVRERAASHDDSSIFYAGETLGGCRAQQNRRRSAGPSPSQARIRDPVL